MENFKKDIIVPINFSKDSENSLEEAIFLSKLLKSKIHLINIIEITDWWNSFILSNETKEKLNDLSYQNLQNIASTHKDVEFELKVLFGRIHEQILKYAESVSAGLIVLCDKHKEDETNKVLGSIVTRVITESKIPVITIKNKIDSEIKNIVIPIDLSEDTERQISSAISFNKYANATLHFVSVLFSGFRNRNLRIRRKALKIEKALKNKCGSFTVNLIKKRKAYAYHDILRYLDKVNADMVVIMTHKEKYNFDNYIGAFAHQIINYSKVPVMTITSQAVSSELSAVVDPLGIFKSQNE